MTLSQGTSSSCFVSILFLFYFLLLLFHKGSSFPQLQRAWFLSLVNHVSSCFVSNPFLTFSYFPDYFLACAQAISSAFLNKPFSSSEPQSNFLPLWNTPNHSSHPPPPPRTRALSYLGIDHHSTQRKKLKYLCIRSKGTKELFIHLTNICWASPIFQYSASCWDTIMSKTHIVPGLREPVYLHILDNKNTKYGDISNIK